jgi:hypothetical protein
MENPRVRRLFICQPEFARFVLQESECAPRVIRARGKGAAGGLTEPLKKIADCPVDTLESQ